MFKMNDRIKKNENAKSIQYSHKTVKSISAFNGVCDIILLASQRNRALLSFASAVNEKIFSEMRPDVLHKMNADWKLFQFCLPPDSNRILEIC